MAAKSASAKVTPESQLRALIAKFDARNQQLIRSVRAALRKRLPTVNELAYDYGSSLVISYTPTEHGMEGIVSTAARADGVSLYFNQAKKLPDPKKLLKGKAGQVRFIRVESASQLKHPDVEALIAAAVEHSTAPVATKGKGSLIIRPTAASKRAGRKPAK